MRVGQVFVGLRRALTFSVKAGTYALSVYGVGTALTVLRYLAGGESLTSSNQLTMHWYRHDGLSCAMLLCVAAGIVGFAKSGKHLAIQVSLALFCLSFAFCFLDFEPANDLYYSDRNFRYDGLFNSILLSSALIHIYALMVFLSYGLALSLLLLARRTATAIGSARRLRAEYQDKGHLILTANALLMFIGDEDEGSCVALDIRDSIEYLRTFDPITYRRKYVWSVVEALCGLVFSEKNRARSKTTSNIG